MNINEINNSQVTINNYNVVPGAVVSSDTVDRTTVPDAITNETTFGDLLRILRHYPEAMMAAQTEMKARRNEEKLAKTGLGLRQMIDWFMYVKDHLNNEHWPAFKEVADEVGLTTLSKVATRIGQLYFGLDADITWCSDADEGVCADVIDFIFRSGNFGRKDYENIRGSYVLGKLSKNAFATLQEAGKHNWKALKKYSWLEPVAWFYQIFRYLKQGAGTVGKLGQNQKRSKDMDELMEKLT